MSEPIDKLIYALDGDIGPLKGKFAQVEGEAQKSGAAIQKNFQQGLTGAAASAEQSAGTIKKALNDVASGTRESHVAATTATREFRALFDELSSGRTRMVPGTLAIIATRVFGVTGATLAWGAAILAIPAAMAVAAYQSEAALSRVQKALVTTGYAAGVTRDQVLGIAQALDKTSNISVRGGIDMASILLAHGNVGAGQLGGAIQAASGLASATGTTTDKAAEALEKMLEEPARGAEELHNQFQLLDEATSREIDNLVASGDKQKAQQIIIDALNNRFKSLDDASFSLAKAFGGLGKWLSDFWFHTGSLVSGGAGSPNAAISSREQELAMNLNAPIRDDLMKQRAAQLQKEINDLLSQSLTEGVKAAAGAARKASDDAIRGGMKDVDDQSGKFTAHLQDLQNELSRDNKAVDAAKQAHSQFTDALIKQRDAVQTALKNQLNPAQEAALRAQEQARINATNPTDRWRVTAQVDAARKLRENLANPAMAPYAQSIYQSDMTMSSGEKATNAGVKEAETRAKNLAAMQNEAVAAKAMAQAYDISTAAAERAKLEGEAHTAFVKKEIDNEKAYAEALRERAFWTAAAATAQKTAEATSANAGLAGVVAAGGSPYAAAAARARMESQDQTAKEFALATTPSETARAVQDMQNLLAQLLIKQQQTGVIGVQSQIFAANQDVANQQAKFGAGTPDQVRQLEVFQSVMQEMTNSTIDPASEKFKELTAQLLASKEKASDLAEQLSKVRQAANDFASAITGPLEQALEHGGKGKLGTTIETQLNDAVIKNAVINPLQGALSGMFGNLFGAGKPDGSQQNPYYTVPSDPLGNPLASLGGGTGGVFSSLLGGSSSGGILGGIFGKILGAFGLGGSTATAASMTADVGGSFGGFLAGGGWIDPGKFYVVGEKGPEILGPTMKGAITPLKGPDMSAAMPAPSNQPQQMNFAIQVSGVGDKDLLNKVDLATEAAATRTMKSYNKVAVRTQRGSLINANKRALV